MVLMIGLCLGVGTAALRSFAAIIAVSALIVVAFLLAAVFSPAGASIMALVIAVAGYNLGLTTVILASLAFRRLLSA